MTTAIKWSDLELVRTLGEGQAGLVWLAKLKRPFEDLPSDSNVAVKCYKSWVLEEAGQFERIVRELELGRKVRHPNLVKTLSIIRDDQGNPALVMTYYSGETLESFLETARKEQKLVEVKVAFEIVARLASTLHALHKSGAIHRDVKPANIILSETGPILMDLGVVRSSDFPERTTGNAFLGTIRYAAPEYLFGDAYDSRVDVYSLGAIIYELFVGKRFLDQENQWARLIVEKSRNQSSGIYVDYRMLTDRYGLHVANFLHPVLECALAAANRRIIDLWTLYAAIDMGAWKKSFSSSGKGVVYSSVVHAFAVRSDMSHLEDDDRDFLRQCLDMDYWAPYVVLDPHDDRTKRLERARAIRYSTVTENGAMYEINEQVKAAYAQGYL